MGEPAVAETAADSSEEKKETTETKEKKEECRIRLTLGGEDGKDETCATFLIAGEDHTIGNALKEIISRYRHLLFILSLHG